METVKVKIFAALVLYVCVQVVLCDQTFKTCDDYYASWKTSSVQADTSKLYPFGEDYGDTRATNIDAHINGGTKVKVNYYGSIYTDIQISWHGLIIFGDTFSYNGNLHWPNELYPLEPNGQDPPLVAAYYTETMAASFQDSAMFYRIILQGEKTEVQQQIDTQLLQDLSVTVRQNVLGSETFTGHSAVVATWFKVAPGRCAIQGVNCTREATLRNTFQAVLVYNDVETHAIITYEDLNWPINTAGEVYEKNPQLGFNRGYGSLSFTEMPYSGLDDATPVQTMTGVPDMQGRFVYRLADDDIHRGGCTQVETIETIADSWPLEVYPESGPSIGGFELIISGPCMDPDTVVTCQFGEVTFADGYVLDDVRAGCVVPELFHVGVIPIIVTIGGTKYTSEITLVSPGDLTGPQVNLENYGAWFSNNPNGGSLSIHWNPSDVGQQVPQSPGNQTDPTELRVAIKLYGYSETSSNPVLEHDIHIFEADVPNTGSYTITIADQSCQGSSCASRVGMMRIEPLENPLIGIWSKSFALGWFSTSVDTWCEDTVSDSWHAELPRCPCTYQQAITDFANFHVDPDCHGGSSLHPCFLHPTAKQCFISNTPTASGAMSSCCYDENDVLIYSQGSTTGSFSASSHRDGSTPYSFPGTVPYLSYLYHDVTPYLSCCGYDTADGTVDVRSCHSDFMVHRPTLNCKNDDTSRHAFGFGDPHFRTFDGLDYTFNSHGEFWMLDADMDVPSESFNLQVRMEAPTGQYWTESALSNYTKYSVDQGSGTIITGVAMQAGEDALDATNPKVMVLLSPPSSVHSVMVFVDGQEINIGRDDKRTQTFPDGASTSENHVTIRSQLGVDRSDSEIVNDIWDPRNITVIFPSGLGVQVASKEKTLHVIAALPPTYEGRTNGLFGTWNNNTQDDFEPSGIFIKSSNDTEVHDPILSDWELQNGTLPLADDGGTLHLPLQDDDEPEDDDTDISCIKCAQLDETDEADINCIKCAQFTRKDEAEISCIKCAQLNGTDEADISCIKCAQFTGKDEAEISCIKCAQLNGTDEADISCIKCAQFTGKDEAEISCIKCAQLNGTDEADISCIKCAQFTGKDEAEISCIKCAQLNGTDEADISCIKCAQFTGKDEAEISCIKCAQLNGTDEADISCIKCAQFTGKDEAEISCIKCAQLNGTDEADISCIKCAQFTGKDEAEISCIKCAQLNGTDEADISCIKCAQFTGKDEAEISCIKCAQLNGTDEADISCIKCAQFTGTDEADINCIECAVNRNDSGEAWIDGRVAKADDGDRSQTNLDHAPGVVRKEPETSEQSRRRKRDTENIDDEIDDLLEALSNITTDTEKTDIERIPFDEHQRIIEEPFEEGRTYPDPEDAVGLYNKLKDYADSNMTANNENMTLSDFLGDTGDNVENVLDNGNNQLMNDGIEMQVINGTLDEDDKDEVSIQNTEHINDESSHTFGNNLQVVGDETRFTYFAQQTMAYFTDANFVPLLDAQFPPDEELPDITADCLAVYPCKFDTEITGNPELGQASLRAIEWAHITQRISGPGLGAAICMPPDVENAYYQTTGYGEGAELMFDGCVDGHSASGTSSYQCVNGQWEPQVDYNCNNVSSAGDWWKILLIVLAGLIFLLILLLLFIFCRRRQKQKAQRTADNKAERERLSKQNISVIPLNDHDQQSTTDRTSVNNPHYHDEMSPDGEPYDPMAQRVEYDNPALNVTDEAAGAPDLGPGLINNSRRPSRSSRGSSRSSRSSRATPIIPVPVPLPRYSRDEPAYDNRQDPEYDNNVPVEHDRNVMMPNDMDDSIPVYSNPNDDPTRIKLPRVPPEGAPPPPPTTAPPPLYAPRPGSSSPGSTDTIRRAVPPGRPYENPSVISSIDDSDLDSSLISEDNPGGYRQYPHQWRRPEPDYPYQPRDYLGEDQTLV